MNGRGVSLLQSYHFEHGQGIFPGEIAVSIDADRRAVRCFGIQVRGAMRSDEARPRHAIDFDFVNLAATHVVLGELGFTHRVFGGGVHVDVSIIYGIEAEFGIAVLLVHFGKRPAIGGLRAIGFEIDAAKGLDFVGLFLNCLVFVGLASRGIEVHHAGVGAARYVILEFDGNRSVIVVVNDPEIHPLNAFARCDGRVALCLGVFAKLRRRGFDFFDIRSECIEDTIARFKVAGSSVRGEAEAIKRLVARVRDAYAQPEAILPIEFAAIVRAIGE